MNIVLTRPLIEVEDLMNVLFKQGHNLIHLPTLKIKPVEISPIDFKNFDAVIFTSSNAVRYLKIKSKQESIKCFCVGSITEKIARNMECSGIKDKETIQSLFFFAIDFPVLMTF